MARETLVGETAARVYGFDEVALRPLVDHVGPTVDELLTPLPADEFAAEFLGRGGNRLNGSTTLR